MNVCRKLIVSALALALTLPAMPVLAEDAALAIEDAEVVTEAVEVAEDAEVVSEAAEDAVEEVAVDLDAPQEYTGLVILGEDGEALPEEYAEELEPIGADALEEQLNEQAVVTPAIAQSAYLTLNGKIGLTFELYVPNDLGANKILLRDAQGQQLAAVDVVADTTAYKISCELPAKEIGKEVRLQVVDADGKALHLQNSNEEDIEGNTLNYSVAEYCEAAYTSGDDKLADLAHALENYGHYAYVYFEGKDDSGSLWIDDMSSFEDVEFDTVEPDVEDSYNILGGYFLSLKSATNLVVNFRGNDSDADIFYATVESDAPAGSAEEVEYLDTEVQQVGDGQYCIVIEDIAAKDLDKEYRIVIDNLETSANLTCSALSYGWSVIKNSDNENLKNVVRALYLYNEAANNYFEAE